jgi:hypothetical protein
VNEFVTNVLTLIVCFVVMFLGSVLVGIIFAAIGLVVNFISMLF